VSSSRTAFYRERIADCVRLHVAGSGKRGIRSSDLVAMLVGVDCMIGHMNAAQGGGVLTHTMRPAEITAAVRRLARMRLIKIAGHNARYWVLA
jgi:hypothetical protein